MKRERIRSSWRVAASLLCCVPCAGLCAPRANAASLTAIGSFNSSTGDHPYGAVVFDNVVGFRSALYTTTTGGAGDCVVEYGCGSVVQLTPPATAGGAWRLQVLHKFTGGSDGDVLTGGLILDSFGALYGTATRGGGVSCGYEPGCGTVFKLTPPAAGRTAWTLTTLYAFRGRPDGSGPPGALVFDTFGAVYGLTFGGGTSGLGTVFKVTPPSAPGGSWTETVLHSFGGKDGSRPRGSLTFDTAGALYGTTTTGGAFNLGTAFKLTPPSAPGGSWTETVLHSFGDGARDGTLPYYSLLFDTFGALYSTTWKGGNGGGANCKSSGGCGTAFKLTPPATAGGAWTESVFYEFDGTGGKQLQGGLVRDTFGTFYGTTNGGGNHKCATPQSDCGTLFQLTPPATAGGAWTHTILADFDGSNGGDPEISPVFELGSLYGTGDYGGSANLGVVFQFTP